MKNTRFTIVLFSALLILPLSMMGNTWNGAKQSFNTAAGTTADPIRITNAEQLAYLADAVNNRTIDFTGKHIVLECDINLNFLEWTPIGINATTPFTGHFDGQGHTIARLQINNTNLTYGGLFGFISHGEVKRIRMEHTQIAHPAPLVGGNNAGTDVYWGAIAGYAISSTISQCQVDEGDVQAEAKSHDVYVGGLVGYSQSSTFADCMNTASISGKSYTLSCAGGISGKSSFGTMERCSNYGGVDASSLSVPSQTQHYYAYAGGISGWFHDMEVSTCSNRGTIRSKAYCTQGNNSTVNNLAVTHSGGLVGYTTGDSPAGGNGNTFTGCFNTGSVSSTTRDNAPAYTGGLSGDDGAFENCYNAGALSGTIVGGICADHCTGITDPATGTTPDNNYYLDDPNINNPDGCGDPVSDSTMRDPAFPAILNNGGDSIFVADSNGNFNGGYPIFTSVPYILTLPPLNILAHSINMYGYAQTADTNIVLGFQITPDTSYDYTTIISGDTTEFYSGWATGLVDGDGYCYRVVVWVNGMPHYGDFVCVHTLSCDSSQYFSNLDTSITRCDSYHWVNDYIDRTYHASIDTTLIGYNQWQCNDTLHLNLTINHRDTVPVTPTVCDTYTWSAGNGQTYTNSADVWYTIPEGQSATNQYGCATDMHLLLTVNHSTSESFSAARCENYTWDGRTYYGSGAHSYTYTDRHGCDSVVTLNLTVYPRHDIPVTASACDQYLWEGQTLTTSGTTVTNLISSHGCDSVRTLSLTIRHSNYSTLTYVECDQFHWQNNGVLYTASNNTDAVTYPNANQEGCDSTVRLNLTIHYSNSAIDDQTGATLDHCNSYTWHGVTHTHSTTSPTFVCANQWGCDSTTTLHLTIINENEPQVVNVVGGNGICDSYTWHGITYTQNGQYTFDTVDRLGCPATHKLNLSLYQSTGRTQYENVCDSYTWANGNGQTYTTDQLLSHTFAGANSHGCDSTITLNLTVRHATSKTLQPITVCDSYTWTDGQAYTASVNSTTQQYSLRDTLTNKVGCDSVVTLSLTVNPSHRLNDDLTSITVCDSYSWHGITYTHSVNGVEWSTSNRFGCDSTRVLSLNMSYSTESVFPVTTCDSYVWSSAIGGDGMSYSTTTNSPVSVTRNAANCDSTIHLNLVILHSNSGSSTMTACDSYNWNSHEYTASGTYTTVFANGNQQGCDSTDVLHLTIHNQSYGTDTKTACDSYTWMNGLTYTASTTTPTYTIRNHFGCDSTVTLHLTLNTQTFSTQTPAPQCDSYVWTDGDGRTYYASTTANHTFRGANANGCDSTITLNLTVNYASSSIDTVHACDSYSWNGQTLTNTDTYTHNTTNHLGCDSTAVLHLTIGHNTYAATHAATCSTYEWHGYTYTPGVYTYEELQADGCWAFDSLYLNQLPTYNTTLQQSACDHYIWVDGIDHDQSGTYTVQLFSQDGCDSTVNLDLTIFRNNVIPEAPEACDSYTWRDGVTYTTSTGDYHPRYTEGTAAANPTSASDCPQVYELSLTIHPSYNTMDNANVCDSYTWNGRVYDSTGIYNEHLTTIHGCDSNMSLYLIVRYTPHTYFDTFTDYSYNPVFWPEAIGQWWDATGVYDWKFDSAAANGCDSIATMNLTVMGKDLPRIISYGNNIIAIDHYPHSQNAQGNRVDFAHKRWYHDGRLIEGADDYDYIAKQDFGVMYGTFWCEVTDGAPTGNNWVPSNVIVFTDDSLASSLGQPQVSPNPAKSGSQVRISLSLTEEQLDGALVRVYDLQGRLVMSFEPEQAESLIQNDLREGVYTVSVTTKQGNRATTRLVVK